MQYSDDRNEWLMKNDEDFLKDCKFGCYQASGPGGQKRNKTFSAVRLTHIPTNLFVIAEKSRSQIENRRAAARKLKLKIAIEVRGPKVEIADYEISEKNPKYAIKTAMLLDALYKFNFSVSQSALWLDLSTSRLIKILVKNERVWRVVSQEREKAGLKKLKPR